MQPNPWQSFSNEQLLIVQDLLDCWEGETGPLSGDKAVMEIQIKDVLAGRGLAVSLWGQLVPLGHERVHPDTGVLV